MSWSATENEGSLEPKAKPRVRWRLERKDGLRQNITGWWIGGGSAGTFGERMKAALKELGKPGSKG